jgi:hypothetical protein
MANPSPKSVVSDALERLQKAISPEDAHEFSSTTLKDVWTTVREIDNRQRKRMSL